jgi:hypothetical protein
MKAGRRHSSFINLNFFLVGSVFLPARRPYWLLIVWRFSPTVATIFTPKFVVRWRFRQQRKKEMS